MKKLYSIIACALLLGVAMYWYFHRDGDKARDAVPVDATAAMVVKPAQLAQKLGLSLEDIKEFSSALGGLEEGIDLSKPVYAFTTGSGMTGFSLNISDKDKLRESLDGFGFQGEEEDGLQWIERGDDGICCFDDDKILLCHSASLSEAALRSEMSKLMRQGRQAVKALEDIEGEDGELRLTAPLSLLEVVSPEISKSAELKGLGDAVLNSAFRVERKALRFKAKLDGAEKLELPLAPIEGNFSGKDSAEPFFWLCLNIKGEQLLPYLREVPELRSTLLALNMGVDADMMIKAINGDVMLVMPQLNLQHPDFILTAKLSDTKFLENADDWSGVTKRGPSDFLFADAGVFFGVRNGNLYITSSESLTDKAFNVNAGKGKYLRASLNVGQLVKAYPAASVLLVTMPQLREVVNGIDCISLTADTQQSIELSLETKKPVKDIISNLMTLVSAK